MNLPKGKLGFARLSAKGSAAAIVLTDGKPPAAFQIFAAGVNDSDYGPITFDDIAAAMVLQNRREKGNPLYFDFNHGMAKQYATAEEGKSAGTFDIEAKDGALCAMDCQYTEEGFDRLAKREYNLFSPYFRTLTDDTGVCRPLELLNVAFLNLAGLNGLQPLAAGSAALAAGAGNNPQETSMTEAEIQALQARNTALETENRTLRDGAREVVALSGTLALGASAVPADVTKAVTGLLSLRRDLHKLTSQESDAGAVGVIEGWREKSAQAEGVIAAAAQAASDALTTELGIVLDDGIKAAKVSPADRDIFETAALAKGGGKASKEGIAYLRARIDARPKQVSTEGTGQKKDAREIAPEAKAVAVQMGVNMTEYELFLTDRPAWEAKQLEKKQPAAGR